MAAFSDPHAALRDSVLRHVLDGRGETDPSLRHAVADGEGVPAELAPLVEKIHAHAYTVTDGDIARLQSMYTEDQLFELIVSASLGASRRRLDAGLQALRDT
jgi:hypothetical protein